MRAALLEAAPGLAGCSNPVDLGAAAGPDAVERAVRVLLDSGEVDSVVAIYAPVLTGDPGGVARAIRRAAADRPDRTVTVALLGTDAGGALSEGGVPLPALPAYDFAESAVRALGHAARYGAWLRRPAVPARRPASFDADGARGLVVAWLAAHPEGGWPTPADAGRLVAVAGVPVCPALPAASAAEAVSAAGRLGYPVVLKTAAALAHKTELGGVRIGLADAGAVRAAYDGVAAAGADPAAGVLVQATARPGTELLVGSSRVEPYPPLVVVGLGGTATDLLADPLLRHLR